DALRPVSRPNAGVHRLEAAVLLPRRRAVGSIAYRTRSTIPALPVHFVGDLIFFTLVWPNDAGRPFVPRDGLDASLALAGAQAVIFGVATLLALRMISSRTT